MNLEGAEIVTVYKTQNWSETQSSQERSKTLIFKIQHKKTNISTLLYYNSVRDDYQDLLLDFYEKKLKLKDKCAYLPQNQPSMESARALKGDNKDIKETKDGKETKDKETKDKETKDKEAKDTKDTKDAKDAKDSKDNKDSKDKDNKQGGRDKKDRKENNRDHREHKEQTKESHKQKSKQPEFKSMRILDYDTYGSTGTEGLIPAVFELRSKKEEQKPRYDLKRVKPKNMKQESEEIKQAPKKKIKW